MLIVKLAQNAAAAHPDKLTFKVESETVTVDRTPLVIPLPGGTVLALDMGRKQDRITINGIVDEQVDQVFIDTVVGTITVADVMTGTAAWDDTVTPARGPTPSAIVTAVAADNSFVMVSGLAANEYFVNNEPVAFVGGVGATALINEPLPSKQRLEQVARYFYDSGVMTLTTRSGSYSVQIKGASFQLESGKEDRYKFKIEFVQAA